MRAISEKTLETANTISHGVGTLLAITGLVLLTVYSSLNGNSYHIVSCTLFGATLVTLYSASTLYHYFSRPKLKRLFQRFDHAAIYLLIAGTYTPFTLVSLKGSWGWSIFGVVWGLALIGLFTELIPRFTIGKFSLLVYLVMGWLILIAAKPLLNFLDPGGIVLLCTGGLLYSAGVIFYCWKSLPFSHAIWHLFVLAGSVCHFFAVFLYVIPSS
ncbi:MAG: hemolysin III family protein [Desulfobulbaceae bacterium]|nr:MAG: hemolysin III family protein [Desulfobulbaceae bacterium]